MWKSQSPELNDALCHILMHVVDVWNMLPRPADSNAIVMVKLKKKVTIQRPRWTCDTNFFLRLLQYLKLNNFLYHWDKFRYLDILINDKCSVSLFTNILYKIDVNKEILVIVQKNYLSNKIQYLLVLPSHFLWELWWESKLEFYSTRKKYLQSWCH